MRIRGEEQRLRDFRHTKAWLKLVFMRGLRLGSDCHEDGSTSYCKHPRNLNNASYHQIAITKPSRRTLPEIAAIPGANPGHR